MNDGFGTRTASSVPVEPMTAFGATWPFHHDVDDCRVVAVCGPPSSRISRPMSWQGQMDAEVPRDIGQVCGTERIFMISDWNFVYSESLPLRQLIMNIRNSNRLS